MENVNIFEVALVGKFRFPYKGQASVEDLFDLNVTQLDSIFKNLNSQLKQSQEESLLDTKTKEDKELDIKIAIIKHIVASKQQEAEKNLKARENREKKQRILALIDSKQNQELEGKSLEELQALMKEID